MMPGDPAQDLMDKMQGIPLESLEAIKAAFGVDSTDPLLLQYGKYLLNLIKGDLGISISRFPTPVGRVLQVAVPWTVGLMGTATIISFFSWHDNWNRRCMETQYEVGFFHRGALYFRTFLSIFLAWFIADLLSSFQNSHLSSRKCLYSATGKRHS